MKFRMVDQIHSWEHQRRIIGVKTVSFEEYDLKTAFGGPAHLPETLLMESLFQLGNWLIVLSSDFNRMAMVTRMQEVQFDRQVAPGQAVTLDASVRRYREDGILFDGRATVGSDQVAVGLGCLAVPVPLADYCSPDDLRVLYSEIFRPERLVS